MLKKIQRFFHNHYHARYHGIYHNPKKLFIFDLGLLALALCMLSASLFFFFYRPGIADQIDLQISLGSNRLRGGDRARLTVDYANRSKFKLQNIALALRLPDSFALDRAAIPENVFSKNSTFNLPPLEPGARGTAELTGRFFTPPKQEEKIIATLSYDVEKLNRREQAATIFLFQLPESFLTADIQIATSIFTNKPTPFSYRLTNNGALPLSALTLNFDSPGKIEFGGGTENFTLEPKETKTFAGVFTALGTVNEIGLRVISSILVNNHSFTQTKNAVNLKIYRPELAVNLSNPDALNYAEAGAEFPLGVSWTNNTNLPLKNLKLKLKFNSGIVDLPATAKNNNLKIQDDSLLADSGNRTALANTARDSADSFTINLKLLPNFAGKNPDDTALIITPFLEAEIPSISPEPYRQTGEKMALPLATEVAVETAARYFTEEGDQLGRGPLPPAVNQTTRYWIMARINNTNNDIRAAAFGATLPEGVEFTGKQSVTIGPAIVYDPAGRNVSWNYRLLPANSQTGLYFEVAVKPSAAQIGQTLTLLKNIKFTAVDDAVSKNFSFRQPDVMNILPASDRGARNGAVVVNE